jgi:hypothetical protein
MYIRQKATVVKPDDVHLCELVILQAAINSGLLTKERRISSVAGAGRLERREDK